MIELPGLGTERGGVVSCRPRPLPNNGERTFNSCVYRSLRSERTSLFLHGSLLFVPVTLEQTLGRTPHARTASTESCIDSILADNIPNAFS